MRKPIEYYVYLMSNQRLTVFYTGQSDNLVRRVWQHKHKLVEGFTKQYNINKLLYYEFCLDLKDALKREKQIKGWARQKKLKLIKTINPELRDLSEDWKDLGRLI